MPTFTGTPGNETLAGTALDDVLAPMGGHDLLKGRGGSDTYALKFQGVASAPHYRINEKPGGDGALDIITGVSGLVQYSYTVGYTYAGIARTGAGGIHLTIDTTYKVHWYNSPGYTAGQITIMNQYNAATPFAQIEQLMAGGKLYDLQSGSLGGTGHDVLTGWTGNDSLSGAGGDDFMSGGKGRDTLSGDAGNDILFGNGGGDHIHGGDGQDVVFAGSGRDKVWGGTGDDTLKGEGGRDMLRGEAGADVLEGGAGADRLFGGGDADRLTGGAGDDTLSGGKGADTYVIDIAGDGDDVIVDSGNAAYDRFGYYTYNFDEVEFSGFASLDDALHGIDLAISGDDLILSYFDPAVGPLGGGGTITVQGHFAGQRYALEQINLGEGAGGAVFHLANLSGDNLVYSVHSGGDAGGTDVVLGTAGDDEIYAGVATDIVLGGGGADHFMFHDEEDLRGGLDVILDFDTADDILDFTDIAGASFAGMTVSTSAYGHALISSIYGEIELIGIDASAVSADIFAF